MKERRPFRAILLLTAFMTGLSLFLAGLNISANERNLEQKRLGVSLADLFGDIRYALGFIGDIRGYYGLEDGLVEKDAALDEVTGLYVLDQDGEILSSSVGDGLPESVLSLENGSSLIINGKFYACYSISGPELMIAREDAGRMIVSITTKSLRFSAFAGIGFLLVLLIFLVLTYVTKKSHMGSPMLVLLAWMIFFTGVVCYRSADGYLKSLDALEPEIETLFAEDLARLEDTGITEDMITDIDGYLARYAEQVPEVDSVSFRDGRLFFVRDQETIRQYLLDYVIQTVLSLAFAIMILFEFRISYKQMRGGKEAGNGEG